MGSPDPGEPKKIEPQNKTSPKPPPTAEKLEVAPPPTKVKAGNEKKK